MKSAAILSRSIQHFPSHIMVNTRRVTYDLRKVRGAILEQKQEFEEALKSYEKFLTLNYPDFRIVDDAAKRAEILKEKRMSDDLPEAYTCSFSKKREASRCSEISRLLVSLSKNRRIVSHGS